MLTWLYLRLLWQRLRSAHGRGSVRWKSRAHGLKRLWDLLRLLRLRIELRIVGRIVFVVFLGRPGDSLGCLVRVARAENDLTRHSLALVAHHHDVVAGALQKLREHVAGRGRTKAAKDSLVFGSTFYRRSGCRCNVGQNLLQA